MTEHTSMLWLARVQAITMAGMVVWLWLAMGGEPCNRTYVWEPLGVVLTYTAILSAFAYLLVWVIGWLDAAFDRLEDRLS